MRSRRGLLSFVFLCGALWLTAPPPARAATLTAQEKFLRLLIQQQERQILGSLENRQSFLAARLHQLSLIHPINSFQATLLRHREQSLSQQLLTVDHQIAHPPLAPLLRMVLTQISRVEAQLRTIDSLLARLNSIHPTNPAQAFLIAQRKAQLQGLKAVDITTLTFFTNVASPAVPAATVNVVRSVASLFVT
jgi:hypothetical protein